MLGNIHYNDDYYIVYFIYYIHLKNFFARLPGPARHPRSWGGGFAVADILTPAEGKICDTVNYRLTTESYRYSQLQAIDFQLQVIQ